MNFSKQNGIGLIEVLVTIAVLGVLIAVTLPQFSKIKERQVLKAGVEDILSSLNRARANTLASVNSLNYGVRFESNQVIIFTGIVYSAGASDNKVVSISTPASITNVTLNASSGTSGELYFVRLSGAPSKTGTITIATGNYSKTITISASGAISSN